MGDPDASELVRRVASDDPEERMPPAAAKKPPLTTEQIELVRKWIKAGAKYEPFWAYIPPKRQAVPQVKHTDWPRNDIDRFLLAKQEAQGIGPGPEADRATLVRRLYFDLTGLPPTPAQVQEFVKDTAPDAYEKLVDKLLASPAFGERMATWWFDLVRFADTVGYHGDQDQRITPYRDYVIKSFNDNLPFNQFTIEQLAGDLLPQPDDVADHRDRLQPRAANDARRRRSGCRVSSDHAGRSRAEFFGNVDGGLDGLLAVPRPQVRSVLARRFL